MVVVAAAAAAVDAGLAAAVAVVVVGGHDGVGGDAVAPGHGRGRTQGGTTSEIVF